MTSRKDKAPYVVGYGRPPAEHRFVNGKSGNPTGRPKAKKLQSPVDTLSQIFEKASRRKVTVAMDGKQAVVPVLEAIIMRTQQQALAGKQDAVRTLLAYHSTFEKLQKPIAVDPEPLDFRSMDANEASRAYQKFIQDHTYPTQPLSPRRSRRDKS